MALFLPNQRHCPASPAVPCRKETGFAFRVRDVATRRRDAPRSGSVRCQSALCSLSVGGGMSLPGCDAPSDSRTLSTLMSLRSVVDPRCYLL
jgi:hypothetical protein